MTDGFEIDTHVKRRAPVSGGWVALIVLTFLCYASAIGMQVWERMYLKGSVGSADDPHATATLWHSR